MSKIGPALKVSIHKERETQSYKMTFQGPQTVSCLAQCSWHVVTQCTDPVTDVKMLLTVTVRDPAVTHCNQILSQM